MTFLNSSLPPARPVRTGNDRFAALPAEPRARFISWFTLILTAGWLTLIWAFRFLPSQDYPSWIYAGRLFSQLITKHAPSCYSVVTYPVPNTYFVAITGLLDLVSRPETSGKIFLSLSVLLFVLGSYRLVGSLTDRRDSALLLLPLLFVYNRSVPVGEINYEFSLGILFLVLSHIISRRDRSGAVDMWLIVGYSLLIFFSHAAAYFCWIIFVMLLTMFDSLRFPRFKTLLAVSPSLSLLAVYVRNREKSGPGLTADWLAGDLKSKLEFVSIFSPLHFLDPFYSTDPKSLKLLSIVFNFSVVAVVLALAAIWLRPLVRYTKLSAPQNGTIRAVIVAPLVLFGVFLIVPFSASTGVYDFNGRFLMPAFFLALAGLASSCSSRLSEAARWTLTLATGAAALIVLTFQFYYAGRVSHRLQEVYQVLSEAHLDPDFQVITDNEFEHLAYLSPAPNSGPRLLPVHESLAYFAQYLRLDQPTCAPLFQTTTSIIATSAKYHSLFSDNRGTAQPSRSVAILGPPNLNHLVANRMTDQYETAEDTEYVLILKRKAEPSKLPATARIP